MKAIWTNYFLPADVDNDGSVTVDELIIYMRSVRNIFVLRPRHIYPPKKAWVWVVSRSVGNLEN